MSLRLPVLLCVLWVGLHYGVTVACSQGGSGVELGLRNVAEDLTPQLGAQLECQTFGLNGSDIDITAGTGDFSTSGILGAGSLTITGNATVGENNVVKECTFLVASSTATNTKQADYLCDGFDDDMQIQAAIDALPAIGGIVQLSDGVFNISTAIIATGRGVTIRGMGDVNPLASFAGPTRIFQANSANLDQMISVPAAATNFSLQDVGLEGNASGQGSGDGNGVETEASGSLNASMDNVSVLDCRGAGVYWRANGCLSHVYSEKNTGIGFRVESSNSATFIRCSASSNTGGGWFTTAQGPIIGWTD